jgi:hypothetical protein
LLSGFCNIKKQFVKVIEPVQEIIETVEEIKKEIEEDVKTVEDLDSDSDSEDDYDDTDLEEEDPPPKRLEDFTYSEDDDDDDDIPTIERLSNGLYKFDGIEYTLEEYDINYFSKKIDEICDIKYKLKHPNVEYTNDEVMRYEGRITELYEMVEQFKL